MTDTRAVFVAELDDAANMYGSLECTQRAMFAYRLMGKMLIIHPAYFWQSDHANSLMLGGGQIVLSPPNANLVLGDSGSVAQYMDDRIEKLRRASSLREHSMAELEQYERFKANRPYQQEALDSQFPEDTGCYGLTWSRDKRFRELIHEEMTNRALLSDGLYPLLLQARGSRTEAVVHDAMKAVSEFTDDEKKLVSTDTVIDELAKRKLRRSDLSQVEQELGRMHWATMQCNSISVPLLSRITGDLDADDPEVFWGAIPELIGDCLIDKLLDLSWVNAWSIVQDVSDNSDWRAFIQVYREIVDTVQHETKDLNASAVRQKLLERYHGRGHMFVRERGMKLGILSVVCSAVGAVFSPATIVSGVGLASLGATVLGTVQAWLRAAQKYEHSERHELQHIVQRALRKEGICEGE